MLTRRLLTRPLARPFTRTLTTTRPPFVTPTPSPPRLSEKEQAEFEQLQRKSAGAFSTSQNYTPEPSGTQEEVLHPDIRRGAPPEFEGDVNPKTGEVGGPKNDPLRHGDYSYNGRVTDF